MPTSVGLTELFNQGRYTKEKIWGLRICRQIRNKKIGQWIYFRAVNFVLGNAKLFARYSYSPVSDTPPPK